MDPGDDTGPPMSKLAIARSTSDKAPEEPETCRICRGEGTKDESLFYPCKCSGSIKYVHQDCLMEWLSHSQKKHCELCKTSFRFTKLYDPQMPPTIPNTVFLQRAALHIARNVLLWCRWILVTFVWIGFLPWLMRWAWRALFWVADGGWARSVDAKGLSTANKMGGTVVEAFSTVAKAGSYASTSITPKPTASARLSTEHALGAGFIKLLSQIVLGSTAAAEPVKDVVSENVTRYTMADISDASLLSSLAFFDSLTPYPTFNKLVVDILEGQIITLTVVVAFILIFLIREWVVQQQPVLHVAALNEDQGEATETNALGAETIQQDDNDRLIVDETLIETLLNELQAVQNDRDAETDESREAAPDLEQLEDLRNTTQRMIRVYQVMTALQRTAREAVQHRDVRTLIRIRRLLDRFREALRLLPENDGADLEDSLETLSGTVESTLMHLSETAATIDDLRPVQSSEDAEATNRGDQHVLGSSTRPAMPGRPDSSLATEIQRQLEETTSQNETRESSKPQDNGDVNMATSERGCGSASGSASGSWQQVPDSWEHDSENAQMASAPQPGALSEENQSHSARIRQSSGISQHSGVEETAYSSGTTAPLHEPELQEDRLIEGQNIDIPLMDRFLDWMWGTEETLEPANDDGQVVDRVIANVAQEALLIPVTNGQPDTPEEPNGNEENQVQAPEAAIIPAQAGNVDDMVDGDAEDLEGILELIGMQGPLHGLFQNAIFSAVLIFLTLSSCVWLPYLWGKVVLLFAANPIFVTLRLPGQFVSFMANLAVDLCLFFGGTLVFCLDWTRALLFVPISWFAQPLSFLASATKAGSVAEKIADEALLRIAQVWQAAGEGTDSDYFHLSLNAHLALHEIEAEIFNATTFIICLFRDLFTGGPDSNSTSSTVQVLSMAGSRVFREIHEIFHETAVSVLSVVQSNPRIPDKEAILSSSFPTDLAYWNTTDRIIATVAGYAFFASLGALYLSWGSHFTTSQRGRRIEDVITEFLQQAGGVLKVILIISIEMILFPLYCGFLLDIAMLPLFEHASLSSRLDFTTSSPWTSVFVHWFVGTCYMFHFALFVSMCRKIMRTGVLYFIRDPDDPTFHPIRDVLERPVTSQLRKIGFSGIVYGALVIVCLGSVVWSLLYTFTGLLPVRWASGNPILGFPLDLVMYIFLMPLVFRTTRPSKVLQIIYDWWLRKCARALRLTHFLFGEEMQDEKVLVEGGENSGAKLDGKYVRVPASDEVRIPKDRDVFLEVDQENNRLDGLNDLDKGIHGRDDPHFAKVFIPSWFLVRIGLFVVCLWAMTAAVGLVVTVSPLLLGRWVAELFVDAGAVVNDIHAFSIGIYMLGGAAHVVSRNVEQVKAATQLVRQPSSLAPTTIFRGIRGWALPRSKEYSKHLVSILYTYGTFAVLFPSLFALLIQFYAIMPLRTYIRSTSSTNIPQHTIHFLQDWTLGLLYLRISIRLLMGHTTRPARALNGIVAAGWLRPNARLATRSFILPVFVFALAALLGPLPLGWLAGRILASASATPDAAAATRILAFRFAYPAVMTAVLLVWACLGLARATGRWRLRIRDEVYLIGERLHNFGEKRPGGGAEQGTAYVGLRAGRVQ